MERGEVPERVPAAVRPGTLVFLTAALLSCATAGPPRTFRFPSNLEPTAALRCATNRLRVEGFEVADSVADGGRAVALRRADSSDDPGAGEWWRVEISITRDELSRTVVQSVAGSGRAAAGPYQEPGVVLQGVVGKISASCTW